MFLVQIEEMNLKNDFLNLNKNFFLVFFFHTTFFGYNSLKLKTHLS